jgi:putative DNA primase/helicase
MTTTERTYAAFPDELKKRRQWVSYITVTTKKSYKDGTPKLDKHPMNPRTGEAGNHSDAKTWGTFAEAVAAVKKYGHAGIGYVFSADDPYTGIDLDDCRDRLTGGIAPWAQQIIVLLSTYAEISLSETGVHLIVRAVLPEGRRRRSVEDGVVEMYDTTRFFVVTGQHLEDTPMTVERRPAELLRLHTEIFSDQEPEVENTHGTHQPPTLDDLDVIEHAFHASNGKKARDLYESNWEQYGYASSSDADEAFCCVFAFWTRDEAQLERIWLDAPIGARSKTQERQDYRHVTIQNAFARVTTWFGCDGIPYIYKRINPYAKTEPADPEPGTESENTPCPDLMEMIAELQRLIANRDSTIATLQTENARLHALLTHHAQVYKNHFLRPAERLTLTAATYCVAQASEGAPEALVKVPLARIAEQAGVSEKTAGRVVAKAAEEWRLFSREVREGEGAPYEFRNRLTGKLEERYGDATFISLSQPLIETLERAAELEPDRPQHGGYHPKRYVCPDCGPSADVLHVWSPVCGGCGAVLDEQQSYVMSRGEPDGASGGQDGLSRENESDCPSSGQVVRPSTYPQREHRRAASYIRSSSDQVVQSWAGIRDLHRQRQATAVLRARDFFPREERDRPRAVCRGCGNDEWQRSDDGEWRCRFCQIPPGASYGDCYYCAGALEPQRVPAVGLMGGKPCCQRHL